MSLLGIWTKVHRHALWCAIAVAVLGAAAAPFRVHARAPGMDGPSFSSAILMPCLGASLGIYLSLPLAPLSEAMSVRRMRVWRSLQGLAALGASVVLVIPASAVATQDAVRIIQNLAVFMAAGLVLARLVHPIAGVALPWAWAMGALLFGLRYSDLGAPQWAWWAWIIGDSPRILLPLLGCVAAIVAVSLLPTRRGLTL